MLDSLLGHKFSVKCKQSIKCIKTRICLIRKRKQATVNFLKKDVVDLLANGHDTNAIGRMDGLIVEMNKLSCYDMIEHFCELILSQLSCLQKKRECPPEEMEAIATLTFAAARFSDLPELGDLRYAFVSRYGSISGSCVNAEFVEKISSKSFSQDKKLKLMEMISQEFSIPWNAKLFNKRISPPAPDLPRNTSIPNSNMRQDVSVVALNENGITANRKHDISVEIRKQEASRSEGNHADDKRSALRQEASIMDSNENNGTTANKKQDIAVEIRKKEASRSKGNHAADNLSALKQQRHAQVKNIHMVSSSRTTYAVEYIEKADELKSGNPRGVDMSIPHGTAKGSHDDSNRRYQQHDVAKNIIRPPTAQNACISSVQGRHVIELEPDYDRVNSTASQIKMNGYLNGENSFGNNVSNVSLGNAKKVSYLTKPENCNGLLYTNDQDQYAMGAEMVDYDRAKRHVSKRMMQSERREIMDNDRRERELMMHDGSTGKIDNDGRERHARERKMHYDRIGKRETDDQERHAREMNRGRTEEMVSNVKLERELMMHDGSTGKIDNDGRERHARERKMHYDRIGKRETDDQERHAREMNRGRTEEMVSNVKLEDNNHGTHVVDQHNNGNESGQSKTLPGSFSEPEKQVNRPTEHEVGVNNMNDRVRNKIPPYVKPNGNTDGFHMELLDDDVNDLASFIRTKESVTRMKDPIEAANGYKMRKQQDGEPSVQQEPKLVGVKSIGHVPRNMVPPYVKSVSSKNGTLKENQMEPRISASSENRENSMPLPDRSKMQKDVLVTEKIPRPRSDRRKHSKMKMVDENNEAVDGESVGNQIPIERRRGERKKIATVEDGKGIPIASERKNSERRRTIPVDDEYCIQNPSERKPSERQKTAVLERDHGIQTWDERKHSESRRTAFAEYEYDIPIPSERKHGEKRDTATMEDDYEIQIQIERKHSERLQRTIVEDECGNQNQRERKHGERRGRPVVEDDYDIQIPSERKCGERLGKATVEDDYGNQIPSERRHGDRRERTIVEDYHRTETLNGRKHGERRRTTVIEEDFDEEEIFMDKLLMHYSKKGTFHSKSNSRTRTKSADFVAEDDSVRTAKDIRHKDHIDRPGQEHTYARANSFPSKQIDEVDTVKRTSRAASMEPDISSQCGGRVYPCLPNYDELAARLHALKS